MYFINLPLLNTQDFKDRFDLQKFVQFSNNVYDLIDSYFANKVKKLPIFGTTKVQGEENRPDLLSHRIYGSVRFWYILMVYNDYISPFEVLKGNTINYPKINDIEEVYFTLNALQRQGTIQGVLR